MKGEFVQSNIPSRQDHQCSNSLVDKSQHSSIKREHSSIRKKKTSIGSVLDDGDIITREES